MIENIFSYTPFNAEETVGVEIAYDRLKLVKISHSSGHPKLVDYATVPFEESISKYSPEFSEVLKSALNKFCGSLKDKNIWTAGSMSRSDIRYLNIPKVSENQIGNMVYWTYKKEAAFNEDERVFTFEVQDNAEQKIKDKTEVMACTALKYDIERLKLLFAEIGFPLSGISLYPFAVQNLFKSQWLKTENHSISTLWIGKTRSRIDIFFPGGNLAMSRNIKTSERSLTDAIREKIGREQYELKAIAPMFFKGLLSDSLPLNIEGAQHLDETAVFKMIQHAIDRLVRQLERTFDHYNINICPTPVGIIYVAGDSARYKPLVSYIGEQVGENIKTSDMDPFTAAEAIGDKTEMPESDAEKLSFVAAIGLALSDNAATLNFLLTYPDRQKLKKIFFIRRIVFAILMMIAMICGGVYYWQGRLIADKEQKVIALKHTLEKIMLPETSEITEKLKALSIPFKKENHRILLNEDMIVLLSARINAEKQKLKDCAARYLSIVAISDVIRITPKDIRLTAITVGFGQPVASVQKNETQKADTEKLLLTIEGVVKGRRSDFESVLNKYLTELGASPILAKPTLSKKSSEIFEEQEVLQFNAQSELNRN
jgi:type IV pilus assembly protein PilM